jgi:hypothetical protein
LDKEGGDLLSDPELEALRREPAMQENAPPASGGGFREGESTVAGLGDCQTLTHFG